jgi:ribosomal protein L24E
MDESVLLYEPLPCGACHEPIRPGEEALEVTSGGTYVYFHEVPCP